ncbi:peptide deformylase [Candidatus Gracilibacteria bacterium]|nr:peptide deformylase [Candidatus Gracilibacteria bacterium]
MKLTIQTGKDNTILRTVSAPVKPQELHKYRVLGESMLAYIKNPKHGGIGLAAPQVGVNKRIIIVGLPEKKDDEQYPIILMINPVITKKGGEVVRDEEGCLSLPGLLGTVERCTSVDVEWMDIKGKKMKKSVQGYGARVIQHEIDHLDGVMICDKFLK